MGQLDMDDKDIDQILANWDYADWPAAKNPRQEFVHPMPDKPFYIPHFHEQVCELDARKKHRMDIFHCDHIDIKDIHVVKHTKRGYVWHVKAPIRIAERILTTYYQERDPDRYLITNCGMYLLVNGSLTLATLAPVSKGLWTSCPTYAIQEWKNPKSRLIEGAHYIYGDPPESSPEQKSIDAARSKRLRELLRSSPLQRFSTYTSTRNGTLEIEL